jgi:hypothetical protein
MAPQLHRDEYEEKQIMKALQEWAHSHPAQHLPMLIYMGEELKDRSLTPIDYLRRVEADGDFRRRLFDLLTEQAQRTGETPQALIFRAIEANRA